MKKKSQDISRCWEEIKLETIYTLTVTDRILKHEDFNYKSEYLHNYVEKLHKYNDELYSKINQVLISENQQGNVVKLLKKNALDYRSSNQNIQHELHRRIHSAVLSFNDQVDAMKIQQYKITYKKRTPGIEMF